MNEFIIMKPCELEMSYIKMSYQNYLDLIM
jgi:hypothetical protein